MLFISRGGEATVFPAYAGMFREQSRVLGSASSFPRIRGDVPLLTISSSWPSGFSPHTRGCSDDLAPYMHQKTVFPAYAGMFRASLAGERVCPGFPRIRGDVPPNLAIDVKSKQFSPHTRGCSDLPGHINTAVPVFPAYAGMFRCHRKSA